MKKAKGEEVDLICGIPIIIHKLQVPMSVFAVMSCGTRANRHSLQAKGLVGLFSLGGQDTRRGFSLDACLFPFTVVSVNRNYLPFWVPVHYNLTLFFDIIIWVFKFLTQWDFVVAKFLWSQILVITLVSCLNLFFLSLAWLYEGQYKLVHHISHILLHAPYQFYTHHFSDPWISSGQKLVHYILFMTFKKHANMIN